MDQLFHIIEGAQIILRSKGTFYQRKLYYRGDRIYAEHGAGFVRIGGYESTSAPNVSWEAIDYPDGEFKLGSLKEPLYEGKAK